MQAVGSDATEPGGTANDGRGEGHNQQAQQSTRRFGWRDSKTRLLGQGMVTAGVAAGHAQESSNGLELSRMDRVDASSQESDADDQSEEASQHDDAGQQSFPTKVYSAVRKSWQMTWEWIKL